MPSTDWKEVVAPDEKERFARYTQQIKAIQAGRSKPARGFHPKPLGGATARFEVHADLPEHAKHGLFATPGTYDAWVRFSNGAVQAQDDRKGDVRGFVIKVLGVAGKKIYGESTTQDFSMIQTRTLVFKNADEFMWFVSVARQPLLLLPRLFGRFGFGRTLRILAALPKGTLAPVPSLATVQFWSPMPVQCGPFAVRYSAKPLNGEATGKGKSADYLSEDLTRRLSAGPLKWELLLQFFESETLTPIEDTSRDWNVPYVKVATLTLPQQDLRSEEGKKRSAEIESHSFNPWHALVEHRPLGDMMRARDPAYFESTAFRGATPEP